MLGKQNYFQPTKHNRHQRTGIAINDEKIKKEKKIQQIKQSLNINLPQKKILKCFAKSQPRRHLGNCQVRKRSNSQHLYLTSQQHMTLLVMRDTLIALEHGVSVTQRKYTTYQVVKSVCVSLLLLEKHQKHHSIHSPSF